MSDLEKGKDLSEKIYYHVDIYARASLRTLTQRGGAPKRTVLSHSHRFEMGAAHPRESRHQITSRQSLSVLSWRCARKTHTSSLPAPFVPRPPIESCSHLGSTSSYLIVICTSASGKSEQDKGRTGNDSNLALVLVGDVRLSVLMGVGLARGCRCTGW